MNSVEVKLRVDSAGTEPTYESVPAEQIGVNRFRLLGSPGFAAGVAAGDEIELLPTHRDGYRILRRSGNLCVQLFLKSCTADERTVVEARIQRIGGWLDGGLNFAGADSIGLLILTIPSTAGFPAIERAMTDIVGRLEVDRWMYGNVYDTADGRTPLNWWL